ncbi:MAG TPA: flagellar motor switch protein FliG, partial [Acetobacteraceae bacterium]|nr:flagellar motor switch protein FliG [Acetobacteraceae bacterium]
MADAAKAEGYRSLNGAQKAALLMLALGEEQSSRLFGLMHEDEIKDISAAMAQLGSIRAEVVERLCVDFVESIGSSGNLIG